jgi:hypothetical protein
MEQETLYTFENTRRSNSRLREGEGVHGRPMLCGYGKA